ncbi:MAG: hypothetical protein VX012_08505 [Planctomycetota bacterium]|nr:hypothetical protein [Planctomycetota bacterium]
MTRLQTSLGLDPGTAEQDSTVTQAMRRLAEARGRIALENRLAADAPGLHPRSPHLAFASAAARTLDGAILSPEAREHLVEEARRLGLREFDAHLVIAVVQDRVRRGEGIEDLEGPLAVFEGRGTSRWRARIALTIGSVAVGIAIGSAILFARWITGA